MWIGQLPDKKASVTALAFAANGRVIYTGDSSGRVLAWDMDTRTPQELFRRQEPANNNSRGVHRFWITQDGSRLLMTDNDRLIDAFHPDVPLLIQAENSWGWWECLLPDEKRMTSVEPEWRVGLWDLETGKGLHVPGPLGKSLNITYHALLNDSTTFLTYRAITNELSLWNFQTGEQFGELLPRGVGILATALSPDTTTFVVGRKKELWVYDVPSRSLRHHLRAARPFRELAFHPNNGLVVSATSDSVVTLWDVVVGSEVHRYQWSVGRPKCLAFSPDGLTCVVGGSNKQFVVFDVDI